MRIIAFEVRPDERATFEREARRLGAAEGLAIDCRADPLVADNVAACLGYDAVLVLGRSVCDGPMVRALDTLGVRALVTRTVGMDHIDLVTAEAVGIAVSNVGYSPDGVADFALMLMLVALRKYKPAVYRQNVNDYSLDGLMGRTFSSMTVGVVGTGRIGSAVVRRLAGFGPTILACSNHEAPEVTGIACYVSLDELLARADLITLHVPSLPSTYHLVNERTLAMMHDGVILVNTARGDLMDTDALVGGMESGKIGALAMDVFEGEQGVYHESHVNDVLSNRDMAYLRQFPNSVLTQHMAFYTRQSVDEMVVGSIARAIDLVRRQNGVG